MVDAILAIFAPHLCSGCGLYGYLLCDSCKYDIGSESFEWCIECEKPCQNGICLEHKTDYSKVWCLSERRDSLEKLINQLKFGRAKEAAKIIADLLDASLPELPSTTVIIPIPTSHHHIRERGYDHMKLIAQRLAKRRSLRISTILARNHELIQKEASREQRLQQAAMAFAINGNLDDHPYLLLDDVVTTGSTIRYAATALKQASAHTIWVAAVSHEPLD